MTAALLNTHLRDNIKVGRGFQRVVRTAGNLTLNSTAWANTSTTLDLTLTASTGDVLEATPSALWGSEAVTGVMNAVTVASGAGFSTRTANTASGFNGWYGTASALVPISGSAFKTVASADISGGNVIVRIRHRTLSAANKTLWATTANPLYFYARNHGPHVAP